MRNTLREASSATPLACTAIDITICDLLAEYDVRPERNVGKGQIARIPTHRSP